MPAVRPRQGGFTLIESAIALMIAAFIFIVLGQTVATALRASGERRLEQQAVAITTEVVEAVRNLTFDEVALLPATSDPTRTGDTTYDPGTGPEPIYEDAGSGVPSQVTTETLSGITFTLTRYITWVDDDSTDTETEDYKRFTVVATWESRSVSRTQTLGTFIASAGSGAPGAVYSLTITPQFDALNAAADSDVLYTHTIENTGTGDDTFELDLSNDLGWPVAMANVATTFAFVDTNGNGTVDTGILAAGATVDVAVTVHNPSGTPAGVASITTLEATSAGDPAAMPVSASANDTTTSTGLTAAPAPITLHMRRSNILSPIAPTIGHATLSGSNNTTWNWNWTVPTNMTFTTDAAVTAFVERRGTCSTGTVEYSATLTGSVSGVLDSGNSGGVSVGCGFTGGFVTLAVNGDTLNAGETLTLSIKVLKVSTGNPSKRGLNLAYDGTDWDSFVFFETVT